MKNDIVEITIGKEAAEQRNPKQDESRHHRIEVRRRQCKKTRDQIEVDERPELENPEPSPEIIRHEHIG